MQKNRAYHHAGTASALGSIAAFVGIGCASCGPLLAASFVSSLGGVTASTMLPFGGAEIGYIGIILLAFSAYTLVRALEKPLVC